MADQQVQFDAPSEVKFDAPPTVKFDQPDKEGLAHKIASTVWSRAFEPVKMSEVERIPGLEPSRAEDIRTKFNKAGIPEAPETSWLDKEMLARAAAKSLTDFYSPGVLAMRFLKPVAQVGAGAAFASNQAHDLYEGWDRMGWAERGAALAGLVGGSLMTGVGVHGAKAPAKSEGPPLTAQDHVAYQHNLLPAGEAGGLVLFKDPNTGGTVAIKSTEMNDPALVEQRIATHREAFRGGPDSSTGGETELERSRRRAPFGMGQDLATDDPLIREHRARQQKLNEEWRMQYFQRMPPIVGRLRHWLSNPVETLRDSPYPETAKVGELISEAEVNKSRWFHGAIDQLSQAIQGFGYDPFNRGRNINHVGEIVDKYSIPNQAMGQRSIRTGRMFSTEEIAAATRMRVQLLLIWEQLHLASGRQPAPFRFGFIENYLPHLEKIPMPERVRDALRSGFGTEYDPQPRGYAQEPTTERRGRGLFSNVLRRRGAIAPDRLQYDVRKLLPGYLRGVSRVLFDRPAIFESENALKNLPPNSTWRQYADAYLDKYTGKTRHALEDQRAYRMVRGMMNGAIRSTLGFSLRLQELHLARLLTSVWPQMNTRDFAYGLAKVAENPKVAYERAATVGILPQQVPLKYMSFTQRFDLFANYLGMADFIDRSVAYEGQYHRYLREGLAPEAAMKKAAIDAKNFSFLSSPAHTPLLYGKGGGFGATEAISQMSLQFKHIPTSILYQYFKAMRGIGTDPVKAAKFTAAVTTAAIIQYKTGVHLLHFASPIIVNASNVIGNMAHRATQQLTAAWKAYEKNDHRRFMIHMKEAIETTLQVLTPGGQTIEQARRYGITSLVKEPSDESKKRADREWKRRYQ
jgi:hypothetical protein